MHRCPTCGRRFRGTHDSCPVAGAGGGAGRNAGGDDKPVPADPRPAPSVPGVRIVEPLGAGGFGEVWLAELPSTGEQVALKLARADVFQASRRLQREADILCLLEPPVVPALRDRGSLSGGAAYIVMDALSAPALADLMAEGSGPMAPAAVRVWAPALARSLAHIHARGVVHRDLKPEHVFLAPGECVATLIDFGLASASMARPSASARQGFGTAVYMAPEQCVGDAETPATDVYAFGVILFEMLTGRPPFFGPDERVRSDHLSRRVPALDELASGPSLSVFAPVLARCLAKAPEARYPDARALAQALEPALDELASHAPAGDGQPGSRRHPTGRPERSSQDPRHARPPTEHRLLALLVFHAAGDLAAPTRVLEPWHAVLAHARGDRLVFAISGDEYLLERAQAAAHALVRARVTSHVLVDLARVAVRERPGRPLRVLGPLPPDASDPAARPGQGVQLSPAAAQAFAARSSSHHLRPTRVFGRDQELARLMEHARACVREDRPGLVTVLAEPGHGKSALAAELAARLRARASTADDPDVRVIEYRARERTSARAELAGLLGAVLPDAPGDARARPVPAPAPDDGNPAIERAVMRFILGELELDSPELRPVAAAPGALELAAVRAVGRTLVRAAGRAPLVLLCDDLHLARNALIAVLEYATREDVHAPVWVCALARPGLRDTHPSFGERARSHERISLGPLARDAAAALAHELLEPAENVSARAVDLLLDRSHCVPLLLLELIRLLESRGALRPLPGGRTTYLAADELASITESPTARWLADQQLAGLSPALRAHARLCALLGPELTDIEVAGTLAALDRHGHGRELPLDARAALRGLTSVGLLVEHRAHEYRFRHALIRDAVAESAVDPLRTHIHRAALAFHREHGHDLAHTAHHAAAIRDPRAGAMMLEWAQRTAARHDYLEAEALFGRALELIVGPDDPALLRARLTAHHGRGMTRYRQHRHAAALEDFDAARALAHALHAPLDDIDLQLHAAVSLDWMRDFAGSRERTREAETVAERIGRDAPLPELLRLRLDLARARTLWRHSTDWQRAIDLLDRIVARADALGDAAYETQVIARLILIDLLPELGKPERAEAEAAHTLALARAHGDMVHVGAVLINRRHIFLVRGDVPAILRDMDDCRALGREIGFQGWEYSTLANRAEILFQWGRISEAWESARAAETLEQRLYGDGSSRYAALLCARVLTYQGREDEARAAADAIDPVALTPWGQRLLRMLRAALAEDCPDSEWDALLEDSRSHLRNHHELIEIMEMRGLWCMRRGAPDAAATWLHEALRLTREVPNIMRERVQASIDALDALDPTLGDETARPGWRTMRP